MHLIRKILLSLFFFIVLSASVHAAANEEVIVSIKPIHSLVQGVMGDTGEAGLIVSGNYSPHGFQMKPSQVEMLQNAKILFFIDPKFEIFLAKATETIPQTVKKVQLMRDTEMKTFSFRRGGAWEAHNHHHESEHEEREHQHDEPGHHSGKHDEGDEHEAEHDENGHEGEEHNYPDMHVWLDVDNAKKIISIVVEELSGIYPQNESIYRKNAENMFARIDSLDNKLKRELATVKNRPFIVFHDAYQYFEKRYDLRGVGSITLEPNELPSASRVIEIKDKIKESKVACVFREPYFSDKLVKTVIEGSDVRSETLDPEATSLEAGKDLYFQLLENLGNNIHKCLAAE